MIASFNTIIENMEIPVRQDQEIYYRNGCNLQKSQHQDNNQHTLFVLSAAMMTESQHQSAEMDLYLIWDHS